MVAELSVTPQLTAWVVGTESRPCLWPCDLPLTLRPGPYLAPFLDVPLALGMAALPFLEERSSALLAFPFLFPPSLLLVFPPLCL